MRFLTKAMPFGLFKTGMKGALGYAAFTANVGA
jgi:hypothetical protein